MGGQASVLHWGDMLVGHPRAFRPNSRDHSSPSEAFNLAGIMQIAHAMQGLMSRSQKQSFDPSVVLCLYTVLC